VLEALACGLPVLAPQVSAIPHMLSAGGGWLLEDTDAKAVAAAVCTSVADPEELHRRSLAARRTAASYTLEAWGELIQQRLEQAWGQPLSSRPLEPKS
jgi:glycosyltransferase involved in cell wall biosynthesis